MHGRRHRCGLYGHGRTTFSTEQAHKEEDQEEDEEAHKEEDQEEDEEAHKEEDQEAQADEEADSDSDAANKDENTCQGCGGASIQ